MGHDVYVAPPPARESRNWSCCLWGCLVALIFAVLISIVLFLVGRSSLRSLSESYTSPTPVTLPTVEVEPATLDELVSRVDTFADNVEDEQPAAPLILTQDEINALIQNHPDWQDLRDKVYVTIEDDLIKGEVNIPMPPIPFLSGRYLHGTATFDVQLEDGRLEVYVESASVNDQPFPDEFMAGLRTENLAQDFLRDNPDARAVVDQIESIQIVDGKVIVIPRNELPAEDTTGAPEGVEELPAEDVVPVPDVVESPSAEAPAEAEEPLAVEQPEQPQAP